MSTTEPYELADIDRIDYLLTRRRDAAAHRESLIERVAARSSYVRQEGRVRVVVSPMFPRGTLFSRDELFERAEHLKAMRVEHLKDSRLVHEAIASPRTTRQDFYFECSVDGVVFYEAAGRERGRVGDIKFVMLPDLLLPVGETLGTAAAFLKGRLTNVLIRYELYGWAGMAFLPHPPSRLVRPEWVAEERRCFDSRLTVEATAVADELVEGRSRILIQLMTDVLWAFNFRSTDIPTMVYDAAKQNGLL